MLNFIQIPHRHLQIPVASQICQHTHTDACCGE